jgi:hypothetical protein
MNIILEICSNALQSAYSYWFFFYTSPAARWFARTVTGATQDTGKDIGFPINQVCIRVPTSGYQPNILRYRGMCRTGILAIHYFMKVFRIVNICWFHQLKRLKHRKVG